MFSKVITYTDYDGNERKEEFLFHMKKSELIEMRSSAAGGLEKFIKKIIDTKDQAKLIETFKDLILKSYGVKSDDGRRFIKSKELSEEFSQTEAYSILFMELASDSNAAADFVNGLVPQDVRDKMLELENETQKPALALV